MPKGNGDTRRPFPNPIGDEYRAHFEGLARGELMVRSCSSCGSLQWPPRPVCVTCLSDEFGWVQVENRGVLYTYTVCHRAFDPWFSLRVPFGVVIGEVAPGVRIVGNTFGDDVELLACDVPVTAKFSASDGDTQEMLEWVPDR